MLRRADLVGACEKAEPLTGFLQLIRNICLVTY